MADGAGRLMVLVRSPLAEGRELKYAVLHRQLCRAESPLAEGRELKCITARTLDVPQSVAPRGGA